MAGSRERQNWQTAVVIGTHWGDEGKGKTVDEMAQNADIGNRYGGADNAGHTVVIGSEEYKIRLVPVTIFNHEAISLVGSKVAVNPTIFANEITMLHNRGIDTNMMLDFRSPLILPWHPKRDELQENARGDKALGTTKRGVGPAMADSMSRNTLRAVDLLRDDFEDRLLSHYKENERFIRLMDNEQLLSELVLPTDANGNLDEEKLRSMIGDAKKKRHFDFDEVREELLQARDIIAPYIGNTFEVLHEGYDKGKRILGEGAQGVLLDLTYGSYPYVTSSHPGVDGFYNSTRIPKVDRVVGVTKAYTTRVGEGPMPTRVDLETEAHIREKGKERGTNTGRDRRVGWFDAVLTRYAVRVGGITEVTMNKIDIFDGMPRVGICVAWEVNGQRYDRIYDASAELLERAKPIIEYRPGWNEDTTGVRSFDDLPLNAQRFVLYAEELIEKPITSVGVGPARDAVIHRD